MQAHGWPALPAGDASVSCVTWQSPPIALLCVSSRGVLFSLSPKTAAIVKADFATAGVVERIEFVDKWGSTLLSLAAGRLSSHCLLDNKNLLQEPPVTSNEQGVVAFACDVASSRLCVSYQRHVLILRRVFASAAATGRFEMLSTVDAPGKALELGWIVERSGARWMVMSTEEALTWINTESKAQDAQVKYAPAHIISSGRNTGEVLVVRGQQITLEGPKGPSGVEVSLSEPAANAGLVCPYIVAVGSKSGDVGVFLESGVCVQAIRSRPAPRWAVAIHLAAMSVGVFQSFTPSPLNETVAKLVEERKFQPALTLCTTHWADFPGSEQAGQLAKRVSRDFAYSLLLAQGGCSAAEVSQAGSLLAKVITLSEAAELFAQTDLFASPSEAATLIQGLPGGDAREIPPPGNPPQKIKFKPGAFPVAIRDILLPLLLDAPVRSALLDSITLRALVLGRPGKGAPPKLVSDFDARKRRFLSEANFCSIEESDRLLLEFPEMWEDHALLLVGKGEERRALEWLRTLGTNAAKDDDRYARATVQMMRPELVREFVQWVLQRHPNLGIEALCRAVEASAMTVDQCLLAVGPVGGETLLLEALVYHGLGSIQAADKLAASYISSGNKAALSALLHNGSVKLSWKALIAPLESAEWVIELAAVLDKLGRPLDATAALAKVDLSLAESYAAKTKDSTAALKLVFDAMLSGSAGGADAALAMAARHADALDAKHVLSAVGDDMPLDRVTGLIRILLENAESKHREHLVVRQLAKLENLSAMRDLAELKAQSVVIDRNTRCPICDRGFKPDGAFARVPIDGDDFGNARVVHVACLGKN